MGWLQFSTTEATPRSRCDTADTTRLSTSAGRLNQLDGLRGIAMLFVFLGHFATVWTQMVPPKGTADFFLRLVDADATLGSSFFMLLSGFFGYGLLMRGKRGFGEFIRGRLWRLYPLYLIMSTAYVVGSILIPKMSKLPADPSHTAVYLLESLLLLPGVFPISPLMDVAWTLSFVMLFYFVEGAMASLFHAWRIRRTARFAIFWGLAFAWALWGGCTAWWEPRTAIFWVGMALSEAIDGITGERLQVASRLVAPAAMIAVIGVCLRTVLGFLKPDWGIALGLSRTMITSATLFCFVWVAYFGPEWWKSALSSWRLRQLGAASYSFYLTHGIAVKAFRFGIIPLLGPALAASGPVFWLSQLMGLVLAIAIARTVYKYVESPLAKLLPARETRSSALRQAEA